jgi:REP element-mobilizing transposase RayT
MPRKKRENSNIYPFHVSARCINKEWFRIPIEEVWLIFNNYLYLAKHAYNLDILNFVLMNNHFHMLLRTPESNLSQAMNYFMREVSKEITRTCGRINQTFGAPYHSSLIKTNHYYLHAYKYVYRNPVEAGLCANVEDYKYSTLNGLLGLSPLIIPVSEDETLFSSVEQTLAWLNTTYDGDNKNKIKKALKRTEFSFEKIGNSRKLDDLESELS